MRRACLAATALLCVTGAGPRAQTDVSALLARASTYVETFERDFGSVVAEERYEQSIRRAPAANTVSTARGGPMQTVLRSDFLLVQVPGEGWLPFRDVFEVDGKQVRDREARLAAVFLKESRGTLEQARAIMDEGARYNIGNVSRNINVPTLPLPFLTPRHQRRFAFTRGKDDDVGAILEFRETGRPTFVSTTAGRDMPVSGRFWVDGEHGTVRKTEMRALDTALEARITVTYQPDPGGTQVWVPARMEERYRRQRDPLEVHGLATYSNFRRFRVDTSEELGR